MRSVFLSLIALTSLTSNTSARPYRPKESACLDVHSKNGSWTSLPPLLIPRQEHSVAALGNNRIYIAGGILSNTSNSPDDPPAPPPPTNSPPVLFNTNTTQYYDLRTATWHNAASLPFNINHGNIAAVNGRLYLLGGLSGTNFSSWNALNDAVAYDPRVDRWTPLEPLPSGTARGACAVGVYGEEIYLAGGMTQLELGPTGLQASVDTVTSYNTRTNSWTTTYPPLPGARDHVAGGVIGHTFYVTGGRDHGQYNWSNNTWALDLRNPSAGWVSKAPLITARGGLASAVVGDKLYTFGGEGNPGNPSTMVFDNVEVYDPQTDTWKALTRMQTPRHGMGAVAAGGKIYVPGGGVRISAAPTDTFDVFVVSDS